MVMTNSEAKAFFGTEKRKGMLKFEDVLWCVEKFSMTFEMTADGFNYLYKIYPDNLSGIGTDSDDAKRLKDMGWAYDADGGFLIIVQEGYTNL